MKEIKEIYVVWQQWGLLLVLGVALGALVGFGFHLQRDPTEIKAIGKILVAGEDVPFTVVSETASTEKEAVESIVAITYKLEGITDTSIEIQKVEVARRYNFDLWKVVAIGSLVGGGLAIGGIYMLEQLPQERRCPYCRTRLPDDLYYGLRYDPARSSFVKCPDCVGQLHLSRQSDGLAQLEWQYREQS